jgi:hypothetical protein
VANVGGIGVLVGSAGDRTPDALKYQGDPFVQIQEAVFYIFSVRIQFKSQPSVGSFVFVMPFSAAGILVRELPWPPLRRKYGCRKIAHNAIDKNSLFRSGLKRNCELYIGFSCSPTYGEVQINARNERFIIEGGRDSQGRNFQN